MSTLPCILTDWKGFTKEYVMEVPVSPRLLIPCIHPGPAVIDWDVPYYTNVHHLVFELRKDEDEKPVRSLYTYTGKEGEC